MPRVPGWLGHRAYYAPTGNTFKRTSDGEQVRRRFGHRCSPEPAQIWMHSPSGPLRDAINPTTLRSQPE